MWCNEKFCALPRLLIACLIIAVNVGSWLRTILTQKDNLSPIAYLVLNKRI
jgi:hypothetical protein